MKRRRPLKTCRRCSSKVPRLAYGICPACVQKDKAAGDRWAARERRIARRLGISMTELLNLRVLKASKKGDWRAKALTSLYGDAAFMRKLTR